MPRILTVLSIVAVCALLGASQPNANDAFDFWRRDWGSGRSAPQPQPSSSGHAWGGNASGASNWGGGSWGGGSWGGGSWGGGSWGGNPWGNSGAQPSGGWSAPPRARPSITVRPRSRGEHSRRASSDGRRSYCVRTCDGFYIPLGEGLGKSEAKRSCDALCPGADTTVFRGGEDGPDGIAEAVSASGQRYGSLATAFLHRTKLVPTCGCNAMPKGGTEREATGTGTGTGGALARLRHDRTLVRGDIVVTETGVHVFTGRGSAPYDDDDFTPYDKAKRRLPGKLRQYLSEIDRAYAHAPERLVEPDKAETGDEPRKKTKPERRAERRAERQTHREAARSERAAARAERENRAAAEPAVPAHGADAPPPQPVTIGSRP